MLSTVYIYIYPGQDCTLILSVTQQLIVYNDMTLQSLVVYIPIVLYYFHRLIIVPCHESVYLKPQHLASSRLDSIVQCDHNMYFTCLALKF